MRTGSPPFVFGHFWVSALGEKKRQKGVQLTGEVGMLLIF